MLLRRHDVVELYSHNNVLSDFNRIRLHFRAESQYFSLWLTRGKVEFHISDMLLCYFVVSALIAHILTCLLCCIVSRVLKLFKYTQATRGGILFRSPNFL